MSAIKNVIHDYLDIRHGNDSAAWEAENTAICNGDSDVTLEQMIDTIDRHRAALN